MKRVVCLLGSPREGGNSDALAGVFCEEARYQGAQVAQFALRDLRFQGCMNVMACKTGGDECGLHDDLNPVLSLVQTADVVVMATPIYFCNVSGLLKQSLDRFFSFFVPHYVTADEPSRMGAGKVFVLVQTQGEGAERYGGLLEQYGPALDKLGFARRELIRAAGVRDIGDAMAAEDVVQHARELARDITGVRV